MIFSDGYDIALWILIANNKKDSERVSSLIRCIPEEVYIDIQKAIVNYNGIDGSRIYKTNLSNIDGYDYYIEVNLNNDKLCLSVYRWIDGKERVEEEYKLILRNIDLEELALMKYSDKYVVGKYFSEITSIRSNGYVIDTFSSLYDRKFGFVKSLFGFQVVSIKKNFVIGRKNINIFKNIPDELNYFDFDTRESVLRLVKKRKRDKFNKGV